MKYNIISIGSAMRDIFIKNKDLKYTHKDIKHPFSSIATGDKVGIKQMYFDIGGGGSNSAATFSNMGLKVALFSIVGNDLAGSEVIKIMRKFKIDTSLVQINKQESTGYSVIFLNKTGDRTALIFRGAAEFNKYNKITPSKIDTDWMFITSLNGNLKLIKELFGIAKNKKIKIAWNPGNGELDYGNKKLKPFLKQANVVLLNLKEAQTLSKYKGESTKILFNKLSMLSSKTVWCVTGAKKGAWVEENNKILWAKILNKKVVNATGAGDAFGSGFVSGIILYNNDLRKALQLGMLNSNSVVTKMGAKHGLLKKRPSSKMLNIIKVKEI